MDLYQIFITHNRNWTEQELIAFSCIFAISLIGAVYLLHQKKCQGSQAIAGLAALTFLAVVFGSTVFTRNPGATRKYELEVFWSWRKVIYEGGQVTAERKYIKLYTSYASGHAFAVDSCIFPSNRLYCL